MLNHFPNFIQFTKISSSILQNTSSLSKFLKPNTWDQKILFLPLSSTQANVILNSK